MSMQKYKHPKYLISDFGGVLVIGASPQSIFMSTLDRSQRKESKRLWNEQIKPVWRQLVKGEISTCAFWSHLGSTFHTGSFDQNSIEDQWYSGLELNRGLAALINRARQKGITTALLMNGVKDWFERWREGNDLSEFDHVFTSYDLRMRKPEEEIYRRTLELMCADPKECFFIDDQLDNIETAKRLGMETFIYNNSDPADSNKELEERMRSLKMI